jgi:hypothetical protein
MIHTTAATGTATTIIRGGQGPTLIIMVRIILMDGTSNALPFIIMIIPAAHAGITGTTREAPVRGGGIRPRLAARAVRSRFIRAVRSRHQRPAAALAPPERR